MQPVITEKVVPQLFCVGSNHKILALEQREIFFRSEHELQLALPRTKEHFGIHELMALSTCNRFEIFGVINGAAKPDISLLHAAYLDIHQGYLQALPITSSDLPQLTYTYYNLDAVRHIFSVASSLDSLVLGETQITGQFKQAMALAGRTRTLGPTLMRLAQEALAAAKRVRSQTEIGRRPVSISHAAIDLAKRVFGDLAHQRFLIIGAGDMARVAAQHAVTYDPKELVVVNRTLHRAEELVGQLGRGRALGIESLEEALLSADIVISATGAPGHVLRFSDVQRACSARRSRPLLLVDIALPRDIDPMTANLEAVYLFDIDDLKQVVDSSTEHRQQEAQKAQAIIDESAAHFGAWLETYAVKPVLAQFRTYLDELFQRELDHTLGRDLFKNLSPDQKQALQSMLDAIGRRMAGDVGTALKDHHALDSGDQLSLAVGTLFSPLTRQKRSS